MHTWDFYTPQLFLSDSYLAVMFVLTVSFGNAAIWYDAPSLACWSKLNHDLWNKLKGPEWMKTLRNMNVWKSELLFSDSRGCYGVRFELVCDQTFTKSGLNLIALCVSFFFLCVSPSYRATLIYVPLCWHLCMWCIFDSVIGICAFIYVYVSFHAYLELRFPWLACLHGCGVLASCLLTSGFNGQ